MRVADVVVVVVFAVAGYLDRIRLPSIAVGLRGDLIMHATPLINKLNINSSNLDGEAEGTTLVAFISPWMRGTGEHRLQGPM